MKFSDQIVVWLKELGYTHCFFVAGGNIMHLLESCSHHLVCIPVVHEVAAGIAAEYFNEVSSGGRALALVTAGPGLTNILTAMAGAYLESRELLVLGGQVKVEDLARGQLRQRGIQEIDGVSLARPVAVLAQLMDRVVGREEFAALAEAGSLRRKGPVFLEIPLDIQGAQVEPTKAVLTTKPESALPMVPQTAIDSIAGLLRASDRPVLLLGGGITRDTARALLADLEVIGIALMCTWNGIDRVPEDHPMFLGRPNTWGQRAANILLQQADLVIALGTRLGLQQTGFNWQKFVPIGKVVQVDCDQAELDKGHPRVDLPVCGDANVVLRAIATLERMPDFKPWLRFGREVRQLLPAEDAANRTGTGFISPYQFVLQLSELCTAEDVIIPCSSGSANTVMQQTFQVKSGQVILNNKSLASMGYGLAGSIGAAIAAGGRRTVLVEGDGGFTQNLQELGTVAANRLNLKIFLFDDDGYASIRTTQRNYFGGRYVGCDRKTGLGLPDWELLFRAYGIPLMKLKPAYFSDAAFLSAFREEGACGFLVPIDPEQTYYPKISSSVTESGSMKSNPLHRMTPELDPEMAAKVFRFLPESLRAGAR